MALIAGRYRPERVIDAGPRSRVLRSVWTDAAEGFRFLIRQRLLRTMAVLIGLLNVTLTGALAVLVLLAKDRLHLGSVGYGLLFTCIAVGGVVGSVIGDRLISWVTATWTIRVGLMIEAGLHLTLAASRNTTLICIVLFAFGIHGALWMIVNSSLRQRLTPPEMLGRVGSSNLFIAAGGNCAGALLAGGFAAKFGITAPYWVAFVVAVIVSVTTWRVFSRAAVAEAYAKDPATEPAELASAS
jgi:predicted MFS family arabinose efflux permease